MKYSKQRRKRTSKRESRGGRDGRRWGGGGRLLREAAAPCVSTPTHTQIYTHIHTHIHTHTLVSINTSQWMRDTYRRRGERWQRRAGTTTAWFGPASGLLCRTPDTVARPTTHCEYLHHTYASYANIKWRLHGLLSWGILFLQSSQNAAEQHGKLTASTSNCLHILHVKCDGISASTFHWQWIFYIFF